MKVGYCFYLTDSKAVGVAQVVVMLIGRFGIIGAFNAVWIYTPEIYPTNLRYVQLI